MFAILPSAPCLKKEHLNHKSSHHKRTRRLEPFELWTNLPDGVQKELPSAVLCVGDLREVLQHNMKM